MSVEDCHWHRELKFPKRARFPDALGIDGLSSDKILPFDGNAPVTMASLEKLSCKLFFLVSYLYDMGSHCFRNASPQPIQVNYKWTWQQKRIQSPLKRLGAQNNSICWYLEQRHICDYFHWRGDTSSPYIHSGRSSWRPFQVFELPRKIRIPTWNTEHERIQMSTSVSRHRHQEWLQSSYPRPSHLHNFRNALLPARVKESTKPVQTISLTSGLPTSTTPALIGMLLTSWWGWTGARVSKVRWSWVGKSSTITWTRCRTCILSG